MLHIRREGFALQDDLFDGEHNQGNERATVVRSNCTVKTGRRLAERVWNVSLKIIRCNGHLVFLGSCPVLPIVSNLILQVFAVFSAGTYSILRLDSRK
jgi:hypothetical protein